MSTRWLEDDTDGGQRVKTQDPQTLKPSLGPIGSSLQEIDLRGKTGTPLSEAGADTEGLMPTALVLT